MHILDISNNRTGGILLNCLKAFIALVFNGFGIAYTIHAGIGVSPWDVFNLGLSNTIGISYGTANITVAFIILGVDIIMREPIGIAMFIDAITVGKAVDFFDSLGFIPFPTSLPASIIQMFFGLVVMGYTQYLYMSAALGCGPRDTLIVGLTKIARRIPIGVVSIAVLSMATFIGWLLGGPVGIGTIICAFCAGPIMQFAFFTMKFDATGIRHQRLNESLGVMFSPKKV